MECRGRRERVAGPCSSLRTDSRRRADADRPVQTFFYRVTWINAIAWGVGYILAARSARDRGPILVAGGAGKLAYFGVCLQAFLAGSGTSMLLGTGLVDFVFAAAFIYLVWTRSERESIARV